jgi:hypothetical protein
MRSQYLPLSSLTGDSAHFWMINSSHAFSFIITAETACHFIPDPKFRDSSQRPAGANH